MEWKNVISLPVYSFWTWYFTECVDPSSLFIFPFVESRCCGEQSRPMGMGTCRAESQVERKMLTQRPQTRSRWCVLWPTVFLEMTVLSLKSFLTLCHCMECSRPGSSVHGISQAWILERDAISFSTHRGLLRAVKLLYDVMVNTWHYIFVKTHRTLQHKKWIIMIFGITNTIL